MLGQQAVRAVGRPILTNKILAYTWEDKRATVLSLGSLGSRLFFTVTAPLVGWASDVLTLPQALLVQAGLLGLLVAALAVEWLRVPAKYHRIKAQA